MGMNGKRDIILLSYYYTQSSCTSAIVGSTLGDAVQ